MSLANIRKKAKQKPPRIVLYGGAGVGKTFFAASTNKPIFILCEDGMGKIEADHFPLATSFEDVLKNLQSLLDNDNDYKTLVVDSLDWLEPLIWDKACQDNNWKSIEQLLNEMHQRHSQSGQLKDLKEQLTELHD